MPGQRPRRRADSPLPRRIKELRERWLAMTQVEFAESLGVSTSAVTAWETEGQRRRNPDWETASTIANIHGPDAIFFLLTGRQLAPDSTEKLNAIRDIISGAR